MRKVEFRAWEKNLKEMIEVDDIDFKVGVINSSGIWRFFDEIELMQYTGLKDRNGKKIFEGDFLSREGFWSVRVEWDNTAFMVRDLDIIRYNNLCFNWYLKSFDCSEWEVIGNIFENPELQYE